jgi:excisionase family DNA binding protein
MSQRKRRSTAATSVTGEIRWAGPKLDKLPPEQRAFVVDQLARILADALVADFRANPPKFDAVTPRASTPPADSSGTASPWLTVRQAAIRAQVGAKTIYRAVRARDLRAVRVGGRRELRFRAEYIDEWLDGSARVLDTAALPPAKLVGKPPRQ